MFRLPLLLCLLLISLAPGAQDDPLALARQRLQGDDAAAQIAALDTLLARGGGVSAEYYQALGNAHFAKGDYGYAILNYERGLRIKPAHAGLANNLRYVRAEAGVNRLEIKEFFLIRWWRIVGAFLGAEAAYWLAMICWWLAVAGISVWWLRRSEMEEKRRFALLPGAGFLLALAVLFFILGNSRNALLENEREAVLVTEGADLRVAPGPDATLEETLHQGLRLRILDDFDGYRKVSLEDGRQGWLPEESLEVI